MNYAIIKDTISSTKLIPITENEYISIKSSRDKIIQSFKIEIQFYCISAGYEELLNFIFSCSLSNSLYTNHKRYDLDLTSINIGRKISNFLSSTRLYFDSAAKRIEFIDLSIEKSIIKQIFSLRYDNNHNYRAMEALRNYSQHEDLPVHSVTHGAGWDDNRDQISYYINIFADVSEIIGTGKLSKRKQLDLEPLKTIDLKIAIKSYFSDICSIHRDIRKLILPNISDSYSTIQKFQSKWNEPSASEKLIGTGAAAIGEDGNIIQGSIIYLDNDIYDSIEEKSNRAIAPFNSNRTKIVA